MDKIIKALIEDGYECDYLDFKEKQYSKEKNVDLIMDIMAMANSSHNGDKFIIVGIKERPGGKEIKGINPEELIDSSNYNQVVHSNIEPDIEFDYFKYEYNGATLGVFRIYGTENKPYMLKKKYERLNEGLCLIRKGSTNSLAKRRDFDNMYLNKGQFEIRFLEQNLHAVYDIVGCASIELAFSNTTDIPITIIAGELFIKDKSGAIVLTSHPVFGLNEFVGADFKLVLQPKSEVVGNLFVGFNSSQALSLNSDEYGICEEDFVFELRLLDARHKQYNILKSDGKVFIDGDFLWKVKQLKGVPHRFRAQGTNFNI
ncbi:ATP-binding protein [Paenibacillus sp. FSL R7-0302]|uniref:AlbA family DNA-binding domain-containing protein n=1 Tax=Paenibacillus sp. FSL R7-0302 TaxID=2921681 RepID=UPI0030F52604